MHSHQLFADIPSQLCYERAQKLCKRLCSTMQAMQHMFSKSVVDDAHAVVTVLRLVACVPGL